MIFRLKHLTIQLLHVCHGQVWREPFTFYYNLFCQPRSDTSIAVPLLQFLTNQFDGLASAELLTTRD
jgi:hypothetical protein